jgi:hypothetical protein
MVAIVTIRMGDIGHGSLHVMVDGRRSEVGTYVSYILSRYLYLEAPN